MQATPSASDLSVNFESPGMSPITTKDSDGVGPNNKVTHKSGKLMVEGVVSLFFLKGIFFLSSNSKYFCGRSFK